jgi:hypothetical protein
VEARAAIDCSKSRFEHIERGRNVPGKAELVALMRDTYRAGHAVAALEEIRQEASKRGWWSTYALPEWLAVYVGLEHDATELRELALESIPGLLQTEGYMRRVYTIDVRLSETEISKRLPARLQRQQRRSGDDPLKAHRRRVRGRAGAVRPGPQGGHRSALAAGGTGRVAEH